MLQVWTPVIVTEDADAAGTVNPRAGQAGVVVAAPHPAVGPLRAAAVAQREAAARALADAIDAASIATAAAAAAKAAEGAAQDADAAAAKAEAAAAAESGDGVEAASVKFDADGLVLDIPTAQLRTL